MTVPLSIRRAVAGFRSLFLIDLVRGLMVTAPKLLQRKITVFFPEEQTPTSPRFRGLHALRRYPNGEERCIACKLCEAVCPAQCITIESSERADGSRRASRYDIDLFVCIYCGLCEEACPVDAVVLTRIQHFAMEDRRGQVIRKEGLLRLGDQLEPQIAADRAVDARYR